LTPALWAIAVTGTPSYPRSANSSAPAASSASRVAAASRRRAWAVVIGAADVIEPFLLGEVAASVLSTKRMVNNFPCRRQVVVRPLEGPGPTASARHVDRRAVLEPPPAARQLGDHARHALGLDEIRTLRLRHSGLPRERGVDLSRADGDHAELVGVHLVDQRFGEPDHPELRRAVGSIVGHSNPPEQRGDVADDPRPAPPV